MALVTGCLAVILLVTSCTAINVDISTMQPTGIRFEIKDEGYSLVGLHYNVNKPLSGVAAGDHNVDLTTAAKIGDTFVYEDPSSVLKPGDKVNYWLLTISSATGRGHNVLGETYVYTGAATTHAHTTTAPSTTSTRRPTPATAPSSAPNTPSAPLTDSTVHNNDATTPSGQSLHLSGSTSAPGSGSNPGGSGSCGVCEAPYDKTSTCTSYPCLVFEDEFNTLDLKLWEHEITAGGGGNWEFQYYTNNRSNSYVRDGNLFLKPTLTSERFGEQFLTSGDLNLWGSTPADMCTGNLFYGCQRQGQGGQVVNPVQSARLRSSRSFNFKYGRLEVEAKMPTGDWIWPAIWLLPRYQSYGSWPASGEIDLVESRGNLNLMDEHGQPAGVKSVGSTLHFGPYVEANAWSKAHASIVSPSGTFGDSFHKYRLDWDETAIKFFVDDKEILSVDPGAGGFWDLGEFEQSGGSHYDNPWAGRGKMAPFDQEFYIILNVAIGGVGFFPETLHNSPYPKPWNDHAGHAATDFWNARNQWLPTWHQDQKNGEDAAMQVKYVKVWKLKPEA